MNALQDPSKKTSINSLLNPQDASAGFPPYTGMPTSGLDANSGHSHGYPTAFHGSTYSHGPYALAPVNWDDQKHNPLNGGRHYPTYQQQSQMGPSHSSNAYPDQHTSRVMMRQQMDEQDYGHTGQSWHQSNHQPNISYSGAAIPYSAERTAPVDYQHQRPYSSSYGSHSAPPSNIEIWQSSERASTRLAAKATTPEASTSVHDSRHSGPPFYGHQQNMYPPPGHASYPQQEHPSAPAPDAQMRHSSTAISGPSSSKRPHPESEATSAPKPKRAKPKAKTAATGGQAQATSTAAASKRGYNSKKRQEAATIAAQNATLQKAHQGDERNGDPGSNPAVDGSEGGAMVLIPELQFARCMSNRYKLEEFPRCVSCTRRWAGDTCRFQGIRYFMRDSKRRLMGISFEELTSPNESMKMEFPTKWNRKFERVHISRSKLSIAKALLPTLVAEQKHMSASEIVRRQRESDVRATCDTCMTSLFSTSCMCRLCGREVCYECFQQVRELTEEPSSATPAELTALAGRREKHAHANPFFLSCLKRNEHGVKDFTPVTRFVLAELDKAVEEMQGILFKELDPQTQNYISPRSAPCPSNTSSTRSYADVIADPSAPFPDPLTTPVIDDFTPSNVGQHITSIPVYRIQIIPASLYDSSSSPNTPPLPPFSALWQNGLPLLVKNVLPRFKLRWDPQYFMDKYGDQSCLIVECQTDVNKRVSIRDFFGWFGQYEDRKDCWKLKDWPPTAEFKTAFPELYEDFSNAVPVPDYVRRDGVYNIGSHFPSNAVGPDLGPKMYNSMASSQEVGSKGSTRLHMDMADALNVMLYAADCPDSTAGYAVWDLFRAEDSDKLRAFLRKKYGQALPNSQQVADKAAAAVQMQAAAHDPIHSQQFYLDVEMRKALWDEYNVKSYRVYQRPGDGVFIPAGCAHQVANMADCMKIAIDFVSPENIDRCEKLTKEFREQNQRKVWKEDVLQLRTMMWFAWQSCCINEAELDEDESSLGGNMTMTNASASTTGNASGARMLVDPK